MSGLRVAEIFSELAKEARLGQEIASGAHRLAQETTGLHTGLLIPGGFYVRGGIGDGITNAHPHWVYLSEDRFVSLTATTEGQYRRVVGSPGRQASEEAYPATEITWYGFDDYHAKHNQAHGTEIDFLSAAWHQRAARGPVVALRQWMEVDHVPADPDALEAAFEGRLENLVIAGDDAANLRIINDWRDPALLRALTTGKEEVYGWRRHATPSGRANKSEAWFDRSKEGLTDANWGPGNGWGLQGMLGGVWESVRDWYSETIYPAERLAVVIDPMGLATGQSRELLGASWLGNYARGLRAAYRYGYRPGFQYVDLGSRAGWRPRTPKS